MDKKAGSSMINTDLHQINEFYNNTYLACNTNSNTNVGGSPKGRDLDGKAALEKFLNEVPTSEQDQFFNSV